MKCEYCQQDHAPLLPHVCITANAQEGVVHIYTPNELTPEERWSARQEIYTRLQKSLDK